MTLRAHLTNLREQEPTWKENLERAPVTLQPRGSLAAFRGAE